MKVFFVFAFVMVLLVALFQGTSATDKDGAKEKAKSNKERHARSPQAPPPANSRPGRSPQGPPANSRPARSPQAPVGNRPVRSPQDPMGMVGGMLGGAAGAGIGLGAGAQGAAGAGAGGGGGR